MEKKQEIPWSKREGKRWLFESGLLLSLISCIFFIIGFSTPNWIVSWPRVYSGFKSIGLHRICLAGLVLPADPMQVAYHGCWWIFSDNLNEIQPWIWTPWFAFTIASMCFCFVFEGISFLCMALIWLRTGRFQTNPDVKKKESLCLLQTGTVFTVIAAALEGLTLLVFAVMFYRDRNWLPDPFFNYLSYSYGLVLVSCFFSIFASIAQVTYVMIVRQEMREPPRQVNLSGFMPPMTSSSAKIYNPPGESMSGSKHYLQPSVSTYGSKPNMLATSSMSGSKPSMSGPYDTSYYPQKA